MIILIESITHPLDIPIIITETTTITEEVVVLTQMEEEVFTDRVVVFIIKTVELL